MVYLREGLFPQVRLVSLRMDKEPRGGKTRTSESWNQDQGAEFLEEEQDHKYLSNQYHNRRNDQLASKEAPLTFGPFSVRELLGCKENFTIEKLMGVCVVVGVRFQLHPGVFRLGQGP